MKILQKQRGGSFYYVIETVDLFKVSLIILETLLNDYAMDGVVVCLDKSPKYFRKVLKKKGINDLKLHYIDTLTNLAEDFIPSHSKSGSEKYPGL